MAAAGRAGARPCWRPLAPQCAYDPRTAARAGECAVQIDALLAFLVRARPGRRGRASSPRLADEPAPGSNPGGGFQPPGVIGGLEHTPLEGGWKRDGRRLEDGWKPYVAGSRSPRFRHPNYSEPTSGKVRKLRRLDGGPSVATTIWRWSRRRLMAAANTFGVRPPASGSPAKALGA